MELGKIGLSLITGIFASAIYGIFLSHREEGIRRFITSLPKLESNYTASVTINRPIQQVWNAVVATGQWHFWMLGSTVYKQATLPLTAGSLIEAHGSGPCYRVKTACEPYHLLIETHEFRLTPVTSEKEPEKTKLTYTLSVEHDNLLEKIGHIFFEGFQRCFSSSGTSGLPAGRLQHFRELFDTLSTTT